MTAKIPKHLPVNDAGIEQEHGVASAYYAGGPGEPYYQAAIDCTCGWETGRCENWEEAGRKFDQHLKEQP